MEEQNKRLLKDAYPDTAPDTAPYVKKARSVQDNSVADAKNNAATPGSQSADDTIPIFSLESEGDNPEGDNPIDDAKTEAYHELLSEKEIEFLKACRDGGPLSKIQTLLDEGISPDLSDPETGETALMLVVGTVANSRDDDQESHLTVLSLPEPSQELQITAPSTLSNSAIMSALTTSSSSDNLKPAPFDIVQLLLDRRADVHAKNHEGDTVLLVLAKAGGQGNKVSNKIFEALLNAGSDINAQNIKGNTVLSTFIKSNNDIGVKMSLSRPDIDVKLRDWTSKNALIYACSSKVLNEEWVEKILNHYKATDDVNEISAAFDLAQTAIYIGADDAWIPTFKGVGVMFLKESGDVRAKFIMNGEIKSGLFSILIDLLPEEMRLFDSLPRGKVQQYTSATIKLYTKMLAQVSERCKVAPHALNALATVAVVYVKLERCNTLPIVLKVIKHLFKKGARVLSKVGHGKTIMQYIEGNTKLANNRSLDEFPIWRKLKAKERREKQKIAQKVRIDFLQSRLSPSDLELFKKLEEKNAIEEASTTTEGSSHLDQAVAETKAPAAPNVSPQLWMDTPNSPVDRTALIDVGEFSPLPQRSLLASTELSSGGLPPLAVLAKISFVSSASNQSPATLTQNDANPGTESASTIQIKRV